MHVNASSSTCEGRDVKGRYKRASVDRIQRFTCIDDRNELLDANIEQCTYMESVDEDATKIMAKIADERRVELHPPQPLFGPTVLNGR